MNFPVVKKEIMDSLIHEALNSNNKAWNQDSWDKLQKENPVICDTIQRYVLGAKENPEYSANHTMLCGMMVYRMLRNQFESDRLSELYEAKG